MAEATRIMRGIMEDVKSKRGAHSKPYAATDFPMLAPPPSIRLDHKRAKSKQKQTRTAMKTDERTTNKNRSRPPTFVTKIRTLFSCWSGRSSRYEEADRDMEDYPSDDDDDDDDDSDEEPDEDADGEKTCYCEPVARRLMQWLSGNDFDKLKDLVVTTLRAVRQRDANQDLPDTIPEALTFICEYLTHVLHAMQFVTQLENSGDDASTHRDLLNERGKCFVDLVAAVETMHNHQITIGKCTCSGNQQVGVADAAANVDVGEADNEEVPEVVANQQNGGKRNRRRRRRGGRRN